MQIEMHASRFFPHIARSMRSLVLAIMLFCSAITASLAADVPERIAASALSLTSIDVTWSDADNETSYVLQRSSDCGNWTDIATKGAGALAHTDTGLTQNTLYFYRVKVMGLSGLIGYSSPTFALTPYPFTAGFFPDRCIACWHPGAKIRLSWADRFVGETGYRIERQVNGGAFTLLTTTLANATEYMDSGLAVDTAYVYRIRAESGAGNSDWFTVFPQIVPPALSTNLAGMSAVNPLSTIQAPSGLTATRLNNTTVRFQWTNPTTPGAGVFLVRAWEGTDFHYEEECNGQTTLDYTSLFQGRTQYFALCTRVITAGINTYSTYSNVVAVQPITYDPALVPPRLTSVTLASGASTIQWTHTTPSATVAVEVYDDLSLSTEQYRVVALLPSTATQYVHSPSFDSTRFRLQTVTASGSSDYSDTKSAHTPPAAVAPSNLRVTANSPGSMTLAWDAVANYSGVYTIERAIAAGTFYPCGHTTGLTFTDPTVIPGTSYAYRIVAFFPNLATSSPLTVAAAAPTTAPSAPSVVATAVSRTQVGLSWTPGSGGLATSWIIERFTGSTWVSVATANMAQRTWNIAGLTANTAYQFRVTASNSSGNSAPTSASATTLNTDPTITASVVSAEVGPHKLWIIQGTAANDSLTLQKAAGVLEVRSGGTLLASTNQPISEIRCYGNAGDDTITIAASITERVFLYGGDGNDTLIANGAGTQHIVAIGHDADTCSGNAQTTIWSDDSDMDTVTGSAVVRRVIRFDENRSKSLTGQTWDESGLYSGASTRYANQPLFGKNPAPLDIHQGTLQDCPFTSYYQAMALMAPSLIQQQVVDLGDTTYAVVYQGGYARVDGRFKPGTLSLLGDSGNVWWLAMEKVLYGKALPQSSEKEVFMIGRDTNYALDNGELLFRKAHAMLRAERRVGLFGRTLELNYRVATPFQHAHTLFGVSRALDGTPRFLVRNPYGKHYEFGFGPEDARQGMRVLTYNELISVFPFVEGSRLVDSPLVAPTAYDMTRSVNTGSSVGCFVQASDVDNAPLTYSVSTPSRGVLSGVAPYLRYTPSGSGSGSDSFTFTASNGSQTSAPATVTILISGSGSNQSPVISVGGNSTLSATSLTVLEDAAATALSGITGSDPDVAQTLTWSASALPTKGTATVSGTGTTPVITYQPALNQNGTDQFTVVVNDGNGGTDSLIVNVTITPVNDAPSFTAGASPSVAENSGAQSFAAWATAMSPGPADEAAQTLTFAVTNTNNALFSVQPAIAANGTLTFTPALNATGVATLTIVLTDSGGTANGGVATATRTATITVTAGPNQPPTITVNGNGTLSATTLTVLEDAASTTLSGIAASDPNLGQTLTWSLSALPTKGTATVSGTGATPVITYQPALNQNGADQFTVVVNDGNGGTDSLIVNVTITPVNDAPSFTAGTSPSVAEDSGAQSFAAWATAISPGPADEAAQTLTFAVTNTNNALFSVQPAIAANGTLTFTPAPNANGVATLTIVLTDSGGTANGGVATATRTATITVTAINDPPVNTALPIVSGTMQVAQILTANTGTWNDLIDQPAAVFTYAYQWQRANDGAGTGATAIVGANAATYTLTSAELGKFVRVVVTATDNGLPLPGMSAQAASAWRGAVTATSSVSALATLSYSIGGPVPTGATSVRVNGTAATILGNTWSATVTAAVGTTSILIEFVASDNSVKSRTFTLVR